jgi:adenosylcobinamide-phosphate synthase
MAVTYLSLITYHLPLLLGWFLDLLIGDPAWLPHPVVGFGKMIAWGERHLNKGHYRRLKGALMAVTYIIGVFVAVWLLRSQLSMMHDALSIVFDTLLIFYCLAGTTLIREVRQVFLALDRSLDEGRKQVARIVGRDTSELSAQEVRTAALETLAENLSDGVIAPLFWLAILGVPGMLAYKMVNTLDSMIGYKTDRYRDFGCWAAHIDDLANYIPARLTALLMILPSLITPHSSLHTPHSSLLPFVRQNGRNHASPNSGYPEAALAGILDCRFGGPHYYFGQLFDKPYIGTNDRPLTTADMQKAVRVNRTAEVLMVLAVGSYFLLLTSYF